MSQSRNDRNRERFSNDQNKRPQQLRPKRQLNEWELTRRAAEKYTDPDDDWTDLETQ